MLFIYQPNDLCLSNVTNAREYDEGSMSLVIFLPNGLYSSNVTHVRLNDLVMTKDSCEITFDIPFIIGPAYVRRIYRFHIFYSSLNASGSFYYLCHIRTCAQRSSSASTHSGFTSSASSDPGLPTLLSLFKILRPIITIMLSLLAIMFFFLCAIVITLFASLSFRGRSSLCYMMSRRLTKMALTLLLPQKN